MVIKNIFIEGLQGAGKSTLLNNLHRHMPQYKVYYEGDISPVELAWCSYMTEEQYNNACLEFPGLCNELKEHAIDEDGMKIIDYTHILTDKEGFHKYMEQYEIYNGNIPYKDFCNIILKRYKNFNGSGNIFECSFLQNTIECLMLFYQMPEDEIIKFYKEVFSILENKDFVMLYIDVTDIRGAILDIKKERTDQNGNELWFPVMMQYLENSPYMKNNTNSKGNIMADSGIDMLVCHLERRRRIERRIINEITGNSTIIIPSKNYKIEDIISFL